MSADAAFSMLSTENKAFAWCPLVEEEVDEVEDDEDGDVGEVNDEDREADRSMLADCK